MSDFNVSSGIINDRKICYSVLLLLTMISR